LLRFTIEELFGVPHFNKKQTSPMFQKQKLPHIVVTEDQLISATTSA